MDGPAAFARIKMDKNGDVTTGSSKPETDVITSSRDMTSPIKADDHRLDGSWNSSQGKFKINKKNYYS